MAQGSDRSVSRREFMAQRMQDAGLMGLLVAAGPVFGRMLNSLYVDDRDRGDGKREARIGDTRSSEKQNRLAVDSDGAES